MTALLQHITHGRLADLNPFDFAAEVKARARVPAAARPDTNTLAHEAGKAAARAEFGCVDWFQYPDQTDDSKVAH